MYTIFKGSQKKKQPAEGNERALLKKKKKDADDDDEKDRVEVGVVLEPGDALVWQGGLHYRWSGGGGGTYFRGKWNGTARE